MSRKSEERNETPYELREALSHRTDKMKSWKELSALQKDNYVRVAKACALGETFPNLIDKEKATNDLLALLRDKDSYVRIVAARALGKAFPNLTDKEKATIELLALAKDEDSSARSAAADALREAFPHLTDKETSWKYLIALQKDEDSNVQSAAADALREAFPHLTDKEMAWKDLLALAKDKDRDVRLLTARPLEEAFPHLPDKEKVTNDLLALVRDTDSDIRRYTAVTLSFVARHYINKRDFKKTSQCFSGAASSLRYGLFGHIEPEPQFYLYEGLGCYYNGRALVSELPEKDPDEYVKNIREAITFFDKSIKYTNKSGRSEYEGEILFFPICLNIYSALYEYNLSYLNFDKKRIANIKKYLNKASAQCKIIGTQRGEDLVGVLEKLTSSLRIRLEEIEQEKKKCEAVEKGKGGGWETKYEIYIDKLRKDFKESLVEMDNILNELEEPMFKKIAAIEKENLEKLKPTEPKTSRQRLYEIINNLIKKFWKIFAAIGLISVTVAEIIKNWQFLSEFIRAYLKI